MPTSCRPAIANILAFCVMCCTLQSCGEEATACHSIDPCTIRGVQVVMTSDPEAAVEFRYEYVGVDGVIFAQNCTRAVDNPCDTSGYLGTDFARVT